MCFPEHRCSPHTGAFRNGRRVRRRTILEHEMEEGVDHLEPSRNEVKAPLHTTHGGGLVGVGHEN